jgi:hypothetical protein
MATRDGVTLRFTTAAGEGIDPVEQHERFNQVVNVEISKLQHAVQRAKKVE